MELKNYKAPTTENLNMSSYGNLLDWVVGSIGEGEGDVDAKQHYFEEDDNEKETDLDWKKFHFDIWE